MILPSIVALMLAGSPVRAATVYADSTNVFTVTIPKGWHGGETNYSVMHYRGVFFSANNRGTAIQISDVNGDPIDLAKNLPRGIVYVDFAHFDGPAQSAMFGPGDDDTAEGALSEFVRNAQPMRKRNGIEWYEVNFTKWGGNWSVWIFCRQPYDKNDLKRALEMLGTLQFAEVPVTSSLQAVKAAVEKLPRTAKIYDASADDGDCSPRDGWLAWGGRYGMRETRVRREGNNFDVSFKLYTTGNSNDVAGEWHYTVHRDGTVIPKKP